MKKDRNIDCLSMDIVNHTNEVNDVSVEQRQKTSDENFDYAYKKISEFIHKPRTTNPVCAKCGNKMTLCIDLSAMEKEEYKCEWCETFNNEKIERIKLKATKWQDDYKRMLEHANARIYALESEIKALKSGESVKLFSEETK